MDTLEKLQEIFNEATGKTDVTLTLKTKFDNNPLFSSFVKLQLLFLIENKFDIEIPNSELKKFKTVKNIVDYLEKTQS